MAITVGATITNSGDPGTSSSYSFNHTCNTGTSLLVVTVSGYDSTSTDLPVSSVTYNGTGLTKAREYQAPSGYEIGSIWYMTSPPTGSSYSIVVTHAGKVSDTSASAVNLIGTATSSPVDNYYEGVVSYSAGYSNGIVNPAATGSMAVGCGLNPQGDPSKIEFRTGTQIYELDVGGSIDGSGYNLESGGTATVDWTQTSGYNSQGVVVTFKPATATNPQPNVYDSPTATDVVVDVKINPIRPSVYDTPTATDAVVQVKINPLKIDVYDSSAVTDEIIQVKVNPLKIDVYDSSVVSELDPPTLTLLTKIDIDVYDTATASDEIIQVKVNPLQINVFDEAIVTDSVIDVLIKPLQIDVYDSPTVTESISMGGKLFIYIQPGWKYEVRIK